MGFACAALPLCLILFSTVVRAEVYTSVSEFEKLLATESVMLKSLHEYISVLEHRLMLLKRDAERYDFEHSLANKDKAKYLSNPMNDYLLVKRMFIDWQVTEFIIQEPFPAYRTLAETRLHYPYATNEDKIGTESAILRLQDTYRIDAKSVARGMQNEFHFNRELSASDCLELGRHAYFASKFQHAESWLDEALEKSEPRIRWMVIQYLARSTAMNGNAGRALALSAELLVVHPNRAEAEYNMDWIARALDGVFPNKTEEALANEMGRERFRNACRGAGRRAPPAEFTSGLRCRYADNGGDAFLLLGPLREEEVHLDPRIVVYRDMVRDGEAESMKRTAVPRLQRTIVQSSVTGKMKYDDVRVSKSTWLNDTNGAVFARISKRIEAVTGLTTKSAEEFEVINYGVGGQYEPHYDFFNSKNLGLTLKNGDRIATVLIYLSDVEEGGATIFPRLGFSVLPVKGSVVVWFNLLPDGTGDVRTLHASCPVLRGSKWIANKWLHEMGQELRRPCGLKKNIVKRTAHTFG